MSKEIVYSVKRRSTPYQHGGGILKIYCSLPDQGVDKDTGVLLLIPGYGGNSSSKVYRKMRRLFPELYNLAVLQCDYFGWEFMQTPGNEEIGRIVEQSQILRSKNASELFLNVVVPLGENAHSFNDMGLLQGTDLINALALAKKVFFGDNLRGRKVIAYGHSHGAYLALLINAMMPGLFSAIVDVSGMIFPVYMNPSPLTRTFACTIPLVNGTKEIRLNLNLRYDYLVNRLNPATSVYALENWYKFRQNNAKILTFHGESDSMVNREQKAKFVQNISRAEFILIGKNEADGKVFASAEHGLGTNYLEHFAMIWQNYDLAPVGQNGVFAPLDFTGNNRRFSLRKTSEGSVCPWDLVVEQ